MGGRRTRDAHPSGDGIPPKWVPAGSRPRGGGERIFLPFAMVMFDTRVIEPRNGSRLGSALHKLAEDLLAERRRVSALRRENDELRAELVLLRRAQSQAVSTARLTAVRDVLRRKPN